MSRGRRKIETDAYWAGRRSPVHLRSLLERAFSKYYQVVEGESCHYCKAENAASVDHAYPLCELAKLDNPLEAPVDLLVVVPCCTECNNILGRKVFGSMRERIEYAALTRRDRYKIHRARKFAKKNTEPV